MNLLQIVEIAHLVVSEKTSFLNKFSHRKKFTSFLKNIFTIPKENPLKPHL